MLPFSTFIYRHFLSAATAFPTQHLHWLPTFTPTTTVSVTVETAIMHTHTHTIINLTSCTFYLIKKTSYHAFLCYTGTEHVSWNPLCCHRVRWSLVWAVKTDNTRNWPLLDFLETVVIYCIKWVDLFDGGRCFFE